MRAAELMTMLVMGESRAWRGSRTVRTMATAAVRTLQNFVDGEYVDASGDETFRSSTPPPASSSPRSRSRPPRTSTAPSRPPGAPSRRLADRRRATRQELLLKLADAIDEHGDELAELEVDNAGKPIEAFKADEIPAMSDCLRFFAGAARTLQGPTAGEYLEGYTSIIRREPIGVVGQITPWNYPLMMAIWKIGPALAGGNTIVIKPAETTPLSTLRFAELAAEILPKGVLNVVTGTGSTGEAIVRHADVDMVSITGSVESGKKVAATAAETLKRVHLELGGKAPVVVFDDADMETALETIAGHRLLQRRPGLHGRDARARRQGRLRRRRQRPGRAGQGPDARRRARRRHDARAAQQRAPARARRGLPRAQGRRTSRSSPAASSPTCPASTSSRRSSPASSRTTR